MSRLCVALVLAWGALFAPAVAGADVPAAPRQGPRICLVLDVSGSMRDDSRFDRMVAGVAAVLAILPDGAEIAIVSFNHEATVVAPLSKLSTTSRDKLFAQVSEKLRPDGGTDILAGTATALDQLGAKGGVVLLLSDGLQTGNGDKPLPESVWGPTARDLIRRATKSSTVVTTIGLGPDAAGELLGLLARDTGGEFIPVRKSEDLVARYVDLAASVGAHWRRSESGQFACSGAEDLILVDVVKAPPRLFRLVEGRSVPVALAWGIEHSGVRAARFRVEAGEYRFEAGTAPPTLLRPMVVHVDTPGRTTLPANRAERLDFRAVSSTGKAALKDLTLTARFSVDDKPLGEPVSLAADDAGAFQLALRSPARTGQFRATLELEQNGWRHRLRTFSAKLVVPPAMKVSVAVDGDEPALLTTIGNARAVELPLEVTEVTPGGPPVDLLVSVSDSKLRVSPDRVRITGAAQKVTLTITLQDGEPPALLRGSLRIVPACDDLTPPRVNGREELAVAFTWAHRNPTIRLRGLPPEGETLSIARGNVLTLPVSLEGTDLGPDAALSLKGASLPAGFEVALAERDRSTNRVVIGPTGRAETSVRVVVAKSVLPGRYELPVVFTPPAGVPVNGVLGAARHTLTVDVKSVPVHLTIAAGAEPWVVVAPIEASSRAVTVVATAADAGALPPVTFAADASGPLEVVSVSTTTTADGAVRTEYRVTVPAQTAPFDGRVRFTVRVADVAVSVPCELAVKVPPVVVRASAEPVERQRFPGWQETAFGWIRSSATHEPVVRLEGASVNEAGCSWTVAAREPDRVSVVLESRYRHTVFQPGERFDVPVQEVETTAWSVWSALASVAIVLLLILLHPWPLKVTLDSGRVVKAWGAIRLDREVDCPGLRLKLSRTLFGGLRLVRRDHTACRVFVVAPGLGRREVVAGRWFGVANSDRIEIESADGTTGPVGLTVGGWTAGVVPEVGVLDELGEKKPRWLV